MPGHLATTKAAQGRGAPPRGRGEQPDGRCRLDTCGFSGGLKSHGPALFPQWRFRVVVRGERIMKTIRIATLVLLALMALGCEELVQPTEGGPVDPGPSTSPPSWTDDTGDAQTWTHGSAISPFTVPAVNAGHPVPTYSASGLPSGLQFSPSTRQITGTPDTAGAGTITVTATNASGTDTWMMAWTVTAPPVDPGPSTSPPSWTDDTGDAQTWAHGSAISPFTVPAVNAGHPVPTYSASGLPSGLQFSPSTRQITGTPDTAGAGMITVTATNASGTDTWMMAWTVTAPPTEPGPEGKVGVLRTCPYPRKASSPNTLSIDIVYAGFMDQWLKDEIECAAAFWENAISGDAGPPYQVVSARLECSGLDSYLVGRTVDDLRIAVHFRDQQPSATAWACEERLETGLPFYGRIAFARDNPRYELPRDALDPSSPISWSDWYIQEQLDSLFNLARHEIAHVLGFAASTAFDRLTRDLLPSERLAPSPSTGGGLPVPDRADVRVFTGSRATRGYWGKSWLESFSIARLPGVPLTGHHWTVWLWGELMYPTTLASSRSQSPMRLGSVATVITLGAFGDMGYEVDYSMAESPCASDHPIIDPGWQAEHCP